MNIQDQLNISKMTKSEWLIALINGGVGVQSGNHLQRYRYNNTQEIFQVKNYQNSEYIEAPLIGLFVPRKFLIIKEEEMTLEQVCNELGREIKIVQ